MSNSRHSLSDYYAESDQLRFYTCHKLIINNINLELLTQ
jgi:hypothetical protein